jgi:hypothetical protein
MKQITMEVKHAAVPIGNACLSASYSESGCYVIEGDTYNYYMVRNGSVYMVPMNYLPEPVEVLDKQTSNNSLSDTLKIIAVTQKPELAIELTRQQ